MNKKFFALPVQKQEAILNAGFCVFSQNSYKKSPTSEIADAAGISKSLLFHYFYNKRELYLFLWEKCAQITMEALEKSGCYEQTDLFDSMNLGLQAKLEIMRRYPHMGTFVMKAYYEKDPDVRPAIQESIAKYADFKTNTVLLNLNPEHFIEGLDLEITDTMPAQFYCNCSKKRIEKAIISIGKKEIQEMIDEGKEIEVKCHFCNTAYKYTVDELKELLKQAR